MLKRHSQKYTFTIIFVTLAFVVFFLILAGCSTPEKIENDETHAVLLPTIVPSAPHQMYIKAGQYENFSYWGHTIAVNYTSAYPSQKFFVAVDGSEKVIQKELTDSPNGIDWIEGNISITLKPVVWEMREGQNIPIYESTWNTTEMYFVVHFRESPYIVKRS